MSYCFDGGDSWSFVDRSLQAKVDDYVHGFESYVVVGWRLGSGWNLFRNLSGKVVLVDAWEPNINDFNNNKESQLKYEVETVFSPIEDVYETLDRDALLIWQHGPEHVEKVTSVELLINMRSHFSGMLFETPNGVFPQGALYGNQYENHLSTWDMDDYKMLCGSNYGFYTGTKNLIGWF